jgi:hypothetical protein
MTHTRFYWVLGITLLFLFAPSVSTKADTITFTAVLSGAQEVPPKSTNATGAAVLILDTATGKATLSIGFTNLSSPLIGAHIHGPAPAGVNTGIIQGFHPQLTLTLGATTGALGNWTLPFTLTPQQMTDLRNGLWYINIHTANNPGGEIRGQLLPVAATPEPATFLLLGAGLFSVARSLRKRRQQDE